MFGIYFSHNKNLEQENFFSHIVKIQNILKLWKLTNLIIEGRMVIFKPLVISKIIQLALVTEIPTPIINLLNKIQTDFFMERNNPKIKHSTLCNEYENCRLKNVDDFSKVIRLQCPRIKGLFDNNFHQWKVIPLYLVLWYLG